MSTKNERKCVSSERLIEAAHTVQDVAYAKANEVDPTTMTELMLVSRKLERLAAKVEEQ